MPTVIRAYAAGDPASATRCWSQLAEAGICGPHPDEEHGGSGPGSPNWWWRWNNRTSRYARTDRRKPGGGTEAPRRLRLKLQRLAPLAEGTLVSCAIEHWQPNAADAPNAAQVYLRFASGTLFGGLDRPTAGVGDPARTVSTVAVDNCPRRGRQPPDAAVSAAGTRGTGHGRLPARPQADHDDAGRRIRAVTQTVRPRHRIHSRRSKHHLAGCGDRLRWRGPVARCRARRRRLKYRWYTNVLADISAAKVATADAAYLASRQALQVLGAIGYHAEHDLSLYPTKTAGARRRLGHPPSTGSEPSTP